MVDRYEDIADEFLVSITQALVDLVAALARAVWSMLKSATRHPATSATVGGLGWLGLAQGRTAVLVSLVLALVTLLISSRVAPAAFARPVYRPSGSCLRGAFLYRPNWRSVALGRGLVARHSHPGFSA